MASDEDPHHPLLERSTDDDAKGYGVKEQSNAPLRTQERQGSLCYALVLTLFSSIGGFSVGYDAGLISGALIEITRDFDLGLFRQELVVGVTIITATAFSLASSWISQKFGRKPATILGCLIYIVGAVVTSVAQNVTTLVVGRAIVGVSIGIMSITLSMYIAETSPTEWRGMLLTLSSLFVTGGQLVAAIADGVLIEVNPKSSWRYMVGLAAVPSLVQLIGFLFLPETPRWLLEHGHEARAQVVFERIYGTEGAFVEIQAIKEARNTSGSSRGLLALLTVQPVRRALFVGCGLQLFQQLSGITTVMYYSATIIKLAGVQRASMQIWLASATTAAFFLSNIFGVFLVERMGRKLLTLSSLVGVTASLAVMAIAFRLSALNTPAVDVNWNKTNSVTHSCSVPSVRTCEDCLANVNCGFCYTPVGHTAVNGSCVPYDKFNDSHSTSGHCNSFVSHSLGFTTEVCPTQYWWITLLGLIMYLVFFGPGMGPMPWTINAEIYPQWARDSGIAISSSVNWLSGLIVSFTFLSLTDVLGREGTFWLYTGLSGLGVLFVSALVPETKGLPLEEVQNLFTR